MRLNPLANFWGPLHIQRIAKEGSCIVIGQVASVLGALVLVRVLTEHLEPTQYGQLALGLTVAGLANQVVMGGIGNGIGRLYYIAAEKQDLQGYLRVSHRLVSYAMLAVVAIGLVLMTGLLWLGYSHWMGLTAAALVFSVISGCNSILSGIQNAARQRAIVAFHGGLDAWLKILLAVGVMLWLGASSTAVVIGYTCSSLLVTVSQLFFLRRTIPPQHAHSANHQPWMSQMLAYSWPFSVWGIFTWMQQVSDRWALEAFSTSEVVGRYAVLFQLGYVPISMVTSLAMAFLGPIMFQRSGDATDETRNANVHRLSWWITWVILVMTVTGVAITFVLHEWIFRLLVAAQYRESSYLLPWVVLAGGLFAAGQMLGLKLMSEMKSAKMVSAKIVTALLGVAFNIYGASLAGLRGVVGALVAFSVIYLTWMMRLTPKTAYSQDD
jgi:O-antigen/teichoic acid export membrane protein